jgi:septal ring factor EnvC (AmiA/AmiB activator)
MASNSGADLATYVGVVATLIGVLVPFILQWRKRRAKAVHDELTAMLDARSSLNPDGSTQIVVDNWKALTDAMSRERKSLSDSLEQVNAQMDMLRKDLSDARLRISELEDDNARLHQENAELYRNLNDSAGREHRPDTD